MKVDTDVLESLLKPENLEVSKVRPRVLNEKRQQFFQLFDTSEKPNLFVACRRRSLESQGKMVHGKRVGKTSGMIFSFKEQWQKPRRARQDPTNAVPAAKLVVSQRRRRPLGPDGSQAKAKYCLRELGKGNVEITVKL